MHPLTGNLIKKKLTILAQTASHLKRSTLDQTHQGVEIGMIGKKE
jgi:hypothetical protein